MFLRELMVLNLILILDSYALIDEHESIADYLLFGLIIVNVYKEVTLFSLSLMQVL